VSRLRNVTETVTIGHVGTTGRVRASELADWLLSRGRGAATTGELAELLGVPTDQVRRRLHAPARRGEWARPAHGLWIPVPPEYRLWGAPEGIEIVDTLMRHLGVDYYVGWLSAAAVHGAAHQAPQVFQVATSRHIRGRQIGRTRFEFLTRSTVGHIPVIGHPTRSGQARVSTREATMLDVASDITVAGGIDNAATVIIELAEDHLDVESLARLAERFPTASGRRVGWILDQFTMSDDLEPLRQAVLGRAVAPSLLDSTGPTTGRINDRWAVRVNRDVMEES
jgi:predicted transcriptional regulator of viral defense system